MKRGSFEQLGERRGQVGLGWILGLVVIIVILGFLLYRGCTTQSSADQISYPYHLLFNVTDVFYKTIDGAPYAVLTFDISSLDRKLSSELIKENDIVYVRLFELGGYATPISYTLVKPDRGVFVEGRIVYVYANSILVSYTFDTIKLPSTTSREPSQISAAKVKISTDGYALIESLVYKLN